MPDHHTLLELVKISEALRDALREAYELARAGESGEPLRETLHYARDLLDLANETLAGDPQAGEHARGMAFAHGRAVGDRGGPARANDGGVMTVTLQLANQVRRLGRQNLTVE